MLGAGVGLASFSIQNIVKGAIGGAIGGFAGGILFDVIGEMSQTGLLSRLIGFAAIGLAIGLFIGLVQELTKMAWLAVEAGRLRGRQFRLEGATAMIGRAEENTVGSVRRSGRAAAPCGDRAAAAKLLRCAIWPWRRAPPSMGDRVETVRTA